MNIYGYHYKNIRPLSGVYVDDASISLKNHKIVTAEGLDAYYIEALSGTQDVSYNNFNQLWLTEKKDRSQFTEHVINTTQYPKIKTTYLKFSDTAGLDKYLVVDGSTGTCKVSGVSADMDNRFFVELEFIDSIYCFVRHHSSNTLKYLTVTTGNSGGLTFTARASSDQRKLDSQVFEYMLDETNGRLTLFAHLSTETDSSIPLIVSNIQNISTDLSATVLPGTTTFTSSANRLYIDPKDVSTPVTYDVGTNWSKYKSSVDKNTNNVDTSSSLTNVKNNFILHSSTNNLDFEKFALKCDLLPLKTLLTPEGANNDINPYSGEAGNNHRDYSKLFTGGNEENGHDSIYTSYEAGIKEIVFDNDKLTYFRAPQILSPYKRANINDLSLHSSGAIAGNTPIKSDKIFKQLRASRNNSTNKLVLENSELKGTWLCSWLSGNSNSDMSPVWVDRYYNPSFHTQAAALTAGTLTPVQYIDNFTYITKKLGASASHITIYDKLSDMTIETGVLYAYYHSGQGNSQKIIDSLSDNLIVKDLREFKEMNHIAKIAQYDFSGPTHTMDDGSVHTGHSHGPGSYELPRLYDFQSKSFGTTDSVSNKGTFTLSFWLYCTDWNIPFGNQIIGNYLTDGFGFYNKDYIAPFLMIPSKTDIIVYNSDFEFVESYNLQKTIKGFVRKGNMENFWIVDSDNKIHEYTINGTARNIITSTHLNGVTISDIDVNGTKLYVLIAPDMSSSTAQYLEYDMSDTSSGYQGALKNGNIWNYGTGVTVNSSSSIHAVVSGLSASTGVVVTVQEALSARTSDTHEVSGSVALGSTSFVDNSGNPWTVQHNKVYTYDPTITSNITALSSDNIIEGVACDTANNIWALHSNIKITKLDSNRKHLFTATLSSLSSVSDAASARVVYNRYIDFITEFDANGNCTESCVTINQANSGCKFVKISLDGSEVTTLNALSGSSVLAKPVSFFGTSTKSWKTTTGHHYIRKLGRDDEQQIKAKLKLSREYNVSTTSETFNEYTLTYNVSSFKPGWNHFVVRLDAEKGTYDMFVNTSKVASTTVPQGAYSKAEIFSGPLTVGATPFYTKSYLFDHLSQPANHLCKNIKIKGVRLYNTALDFYDIKAHYDVFNVVMPVRWNMPTGQRSYLDTIERVFNFRVPGRKSELFNLNIYNTSLTDDKLKKDLQAIIQDNIYSSVPAYTKLQSIKWDGQTLSAAGSAIESTSTNVRQPIAGFADNVYIEGGDFYYD